MAQTTTQTITEFLLARIAEDEAAARAHLASTAWGNPYDDGTGIENTFTGERVLAECEAKRRIVQRALHIESLEDQSGSFAFADLEYDEHILPALASVYADHPDYRDEWA